VALPAAAQTPVSSRRDLVAGQARPYGVEIRPDSGSECRVGFDTARPTDVTTGACAWEAPTPFTLIWSRHEVRLTVGGTTVRRAATWQIGNAIHFRVAGHARLVVATVNGRPDQTTVAGNDPDVPADAWISGWNLTRGWTITGTIERRSPTAADDVSITVADDPAVPGAQTVPRAFTGGIAGPYSAGAQAVAAASGTVPPGTRTWTGSNGSNWSDARNWDPQGVPQSNEQLIFGQAGQNRKDTNNNIPGLVVGGITVQSGYSYSFGGEGLTLAVGSVSTVGDKFTVASLAGGGQLTFSNELHVDMARSTAFGGSLSGPSLFLENGDGTFTLGGNGSSISETTVRKGVLALAGGSLGKVIVNGGGAFGGSTLGGTVNGDFIMNGADYVQPIAGDNSFQQITIRSPATNISIGGTEISIVLTYVPPEGKQFLIINNQTGGSVNGNFKLQGQGSLKEGDTFTVNGVTFQISYRGGDGNDVVLNVIKSTATDKPDLTITKDHSPKPFVVGQQGTFTLLVRNDGKASTTGAAVTVSDTMPAGLVPTAIRGNGWSCPVQTSVTCTSTATVAPGASFPAIEITVSVADTAVNTTNTATVVGGGDDTPASATDSVSVARGVDFAIVKTNSGSFIKGQQGTFVLTVTNVGTSSSSTPITVTDVIPAGLSVVGASGDGWSCTTGPTVTCTRTAALPPSVASQITLVVNILATAPDSITNTARVASDEDGNNSNNSSDRTVPIATLKPDLSITKSHADPFSPGQAAATFTLTVRNDGQGQTTAPIGVDDELPGGLTPTAASGTNWSCTVNAQRVQCTTTNSLQPSATASPITLTVNVSPTATSTSNTVTVSGGGDDTPSTFTDTVNIRGTPPDLTITKTHAGNVIQGGSVAFQIAVSNVGTTPTNGAVTVIDTLPAGLTPTSATGTGWTCRIAGADVTCNRNDALAGSGSAFPPIVLAANVSSTATSTENVATVSGGGDVSTGNNTARDAVRINTVDPDLAVTKSHQGNFRQGGTATFTISVQNIGQAATIGTVTVVDTLPPGLTNASGSGSGWTCQASSAQSLTCTRSDALRAGTAYPDLTVQAAVGPTAASDVNNVEVSGGGDASPRNNSASDRYVVEGTPILTVAKTHAGDFHQGQVGATYTVTVHNAGPVPSVGRIGLVDSLPGGLKPTGAVGANWTCTIASQTVTCERTAPLDSQASSTVTITVNVADTATNVINVVSMSGGGDPTTAGKEAHDPTTILGRPQLSIAKAHPDPVQQGQQGLQFSIVVSNTGTGPTTGAVTVTDTLPAGLQPTDVSATSWTCNLAGQTASCSRSDALGPGTSYDVIRLSVNVAGNAETTTNSASVSGGGDANQHTASDRVVISSPGVPNLVMVKQHDGDFFQGQVGAAYRLRVENHGQAPSNGPITVTDDVPAGLQPTSATGDGWNCAIAGQHVSCTRTDALQPGTSSPLIHLLVNVSPTATSVVNVATLGGGNDITPIENTASDATTIAPRAPDLRIAKRHQDPFSAGQTGAIYLITVSNAGSGPTAGEVTATDDVPAGMTPTSAAGPGWTCAIDGQVVTCRRSDVLQGGDHYPDITLTVNVGANASGIANLATVSGGGDVSTANNGASDFTNINGRVDAAITLSLPVSMLTGQAAAYVASVANVGSGTIGGDTLVTVTLPETLTPVIGAGGGWQCQNDGPRFLCSHAGPLSPGASFPDLTLRALVGGGPGAVTTTATVAAAYDINPSNDHAELTSTITQPVAALAISKTAAIPRVAIGGTLTYRVTVRNIGTARVADAVVSDLLPRGFKYIEAASDLQSTTRSARQLRGTGNQDVLEWPLHTLSPGETVNIVYRVVVGADARKGLQDNRATVSGVGALAEPVSAAPAIATVEVTDETFSMLQALVGRVFEDVDGDGRFTAADRPVPGARIITSTGQASVTDPDGLYNIPSLGAGSIAVSLDRSTVPAHLTVADNGPGERSWTRLLRTPIGGGTVLRQNFALVTAQGESVEKPPDVALTEAPLAPALPIDPPAGPLPPRRDYETRAGASVLIALGEVSFGQAAPEFEVFSKDGSAWGYGSVFLQTPVGSPKNQLTFAYDSHQNLNGTTGQDRLFELDPNDRLYPVFGDTSWRQEFATSNSKFFGRLERGQSHVMWGDLIGDLPSSDHDGGRLSAYQRHLTGAEAKLADANGNGVVVRGAQPTTSYARDVYSGSSLGLLELTHVRILPGTETIAVEVRDRRMPERVVSREVLARGADYTLEPLSGGVFLQRHIGGLDSALNLVQIVATYEYESGGVDNMVYGTRASWAKRGLRVGGSFFTEEGTGDGRFNLAGVEVEQRLPRGGRARVEVPYSNGVPSVTTSVDSRAIAASSSADGFGVQADVEQPFDFWNGRATAKVLGASQRFQNPFSSTITPGAQYAAGAVELHPRTPSLLRVGASDEQYESATTDADRVTVSGSWSETIAGHVTLTGGYDARHLEQNATTTDSGLVTAAARVTVGNRLEASVGREQNVLDKSDPTYPDQTTVGARLKMSEQTNIFYSQRISEAAIVPIGDFSSTGFTQLPTKSELSLGVESRVADATQLTSRYQVDQGINGPDAFAVIGVATQLKLGKGFSGTFGGEHGKLVSGSGDDYTSGTVGVAYLGSDRYKATARYEARDRSGFASLFTTGVAGRLGGGLTGLVRLEWLNAASDQPQGDSLSLLGALALRPTTNDRAGLLLSYQYLDRQDAVQTFAPNRDALGLRQRASTDGYVQPIGWLELHGKFAWQQTSDPGQYVSTYLGQGRAQVTIWRSIDAAIETRYIWQPFTDSSRKGTGAELGFWPVADLRAALGYSFNDTRDPLGRDLEGRAKGFYFTLSTKLSRLFNLLGSTPPPASSSPRP